MREQWSLRDRRIERLAAVSPAASPRRATVASKTLAEQLQPLVRISLAIGSRRYATVDVARARERLPARALSPVGLREA